MRVFVHFILYLALPAAAFFGGYRLTDLFFRQRIVPLQFEPTGIAVGAGCALWTLAILVWSFGKDKKKGGTS